MTFYSHVMLIAFSLTLICRSDCIYWTNVCNCDRIINLSSVMSFYICFSWKKIWPLTFKLQFIEIVLSWYWKSVIIYSSALSVTIVAALRSGFALSQSYFWSHVIFSVLISQGFTRRALRLYCVITAHSVIPSYC